jgi:hypothetical protein
LSVRCDRKVSFDFDTQFAGSERAWGAAPVPPPRGLDAVNALIAWQLEPPRSTCGNRGIRTFNRAVPPEVRGEKSGAHLETR